MFDVAGFGASSIDLVYLLPAHPSADGPLSKLPIQSSFTSCGGQTATAMAGCASLGLRSAFLGTTGHDDRGSLIRQELIARGVDVTSGHILPCAQPYAVILLSEHSPERIVLWSRTADANLDPAALDIAAMTSGRVLHVDDVDLAASIAAARLARKAGRLVTTDIDRVAPETSELIRLATHPILAEHVPRELTGEPDLERALRMLRPLNAGPITVTLGARGAASLDGERLIVSPGFAVHAVDTTGAGDIFRAGFIAALLEERDLPGVLRYANAAAAVSCTRRGAVAGAPSRAEVETVLVSL
ncbi:MAG: PfkB family carbohydrate kinase [Acidobacteriota bacterium]|nr:PfkB family carbohydrate kinase [Acidobacteriota bacterium]